MAIDVANTKVRAYDVSIGGSDIGLVDGVEWTVELVTTPIKADQLYGQEMGDRLIGVNVRAKGNAREITAANLARILPWGDGNLCPAALGGDLYGYAVPVVLHPKDKGAAVDEDLNLLKAVVIGPATLTGNGETDAVIPLEIKAYPDRGQLPNFVIGTIGGGA